MHGAAPIRLNVFPWAEIRFPLQERLLHKVGPVYFGEVNPKQLGGGRQGGQGGPRPIAKREGAD